MNHGKGSLSVMQCHCYSKFCCFDASSVNSHSEMPEGHMKMEMTHDAVKLKLDYT